MTLSCLDCNEGTCATRRIFFCDPCSERRKANNTDPIPPRWRGERKRTEGEFNGGHENAERAREEAA